MVDILALFMYGNVDDGMDLSCTSLFNVGCALFVGNGLSGWYTYLIRYIGTNIIVFNTDLGCWHNCANFVVDGFADGFHTCVFQFCAATVLRRF